MTSPRTPVGDKHVLPTGSVDAARLDVIHAVYGPVSMKGLEAAAILQRAVPEGVLSRERGTELIAGMERHTASPDVWVAVAKMFAAVGYKRPTA